LRGWILDLYPGNPGEMVVWLKLENGEARRLVDEWSPSVFVSSGDGGRLQRLPREKGVEPEVRLSRVVEKLEQITDQSKSRVLELEVRDAKRTQLLARRIEDLGEFGDYRIYNADVPPAQTYLYEHDLFPLAHCDVSETGRGLEWKLLDDVWSYDYEVPELRETKLDVGVEREGRIPRYTDPIGSLTLTTGEERMVIEGGSEEEKLLELSKAVGVLDPDLLLTEEGDTFLLPYLIKRAEKNGVLGRFFLDRDRSSLRLPSRPGTSYFSYGKILFKPSAMKLSGRVHLDLSSSFVCGGENLEGLFELSRVCRMPLQTASRASIGKALSSLQFYHASKMDLLVPWKPVLAEKFKDRWTLMLADRGGFIFEPRVGLFEGIGELDFSSLYPNIMLKKNLSAETVRCPCCPDSTNRIPELDWNVCEKRVGIVPRAIDIIVRKRLNYKERKTKTRSRDERKKYDARQSALKWLGVTCLPGESYVLVENREWSRCVKIGEFIDSLVGDATGVIECPTDVFVAGIGHDLKARYCKVRRLIKQPNDQKLLHVRMKDGREVVVTPDHPFFVLNSGELNVKPANELEIDDFVPVAKRIPPPPAERSMVDLIESLKERLSEEELLLWRVSGVPRERIGENKQRLIKEALSEGYTYQVINGWIKSGVIPLKFFFSLSLNIQPESHERLRVGVGRRLGGRMAWVPAVLPVDEELGFFLGLFVADGSSARNSVRIDIGLSEPDLLANTKDVVESLFKISPKVYKERKARMQVLQINSAGLVRVLERVFGLPGSSEKGKLKVPDLVLNSEGAARGFLEGMIAGDGYVSKRRSFINIATKSRELQAQLGFLAARLGLSFRIARQRMKTWPLYTVNFVGPDTLLRIANWRFLKNAHREVARRSWHKESGSSCSHTVYQRLPVEESGLLVLTEATRTTSNPHVRQGSEMCPTAVMEKISRIHAKNLGEKVVLQMSKVERLLDGDLGFVRVVQIEELASRPEYVYCFQLEADEIPGFFTGQGVTLTHNCFGYLGFNNAKFGRIDAHIGVCAWDRRVLLDAVRVAERRGFRLIHGIVDSLWLEKGGAGEDDYQELGKQIEAETGFEISFEGVYKWIAFLPSKVEPGVPVLNRYFGAYRSGELKVRGIEARRHDTPALFSKCQIEILTLLAEADSVAEARGLVPDCLGVFARFAGYISRREVPPELLLFTRNLSRKPGEYRNQTIQASVAEQLSSEGVELHAGESVRYVITDYHSRSPSRRAAPEALLDDGTPYDVGRYIELLAEACSTVLEPFDAGCSKGRLVRRFRNADLM